MVLSCVGLGTREETQAACLWTPLYVLLSAPTNRPVEAPEPCLPVPAVLLSVLRRVRLAKLAGGQWTPPSAAATKDATHEYTPPRIAEESPEEFAGPSTPAYKQPTCTVGLVGYPGL
jgi:hypothetical protein